LDCPETQQLLHAYVDGELDLLKSLEVEQHLQACPACARAHKALGAVRATLQRGAPYFQPPPDLRNRIQAAVRRAEDRARPAVRPLRWRGPAVAAALVLVALAGWGLGRYLPPRSADALLTDNLVASHVRSQMLANHKVDVESSNQHTVKPWFEGKLDYSPPVYNLTGDGFPLVGGRLDYVDHRPVAVLVYRRREHLINLFVWPSEPVVAPAPTVLTRQGFHLLHWTQSGMSYWAVSNLNEGELREFAQLIQDKAP
jgi:anti-sigma factor RsiW